MVKEGLYADLIEPPRHHISPSGISPITPNRRGTGSMKKYYQAALIAVALLSLATLLFYRHEYNRLRFVLEVLNVYGKPGVVETDQNCKNNVNQIDLLFNSPIPSWQRINDELFIYSAHRVSKNEIRAIAFGKVYEKLDLSCNVFFEGKAPILGTFKHSKIGDDLENAGYQLICEYEGIAIPESVSFFNRETGFENETPIMNVKNSPDNLMTNEMGLCVAPPMNRSISRTDMISFINFHQIIGVQHFVIYDYGIPSRFTQTVKDIINSQSLNVTFTILPWNFPFGVSQDIGKRILEIDCLYRSRNEVEYSATLYWEEYIVLKYQQNLLKALTDFDKSTLNAERYLVHTSVFCTDQENDKLSIGSAPMILRLNNRLLFGSVKTQDVYISKPHNSLNLDKSVTTKVDIDSMNINHYRYCSEPANKLSSTHDDSIQRLAIEIFDTPLYKEYITRQALSAK